MDEFVICIDDSVEGITKNKIYKIEYEIVGGISKWAKRIKIIMRECSQ